MNNLKKIAVIGLGYVGLPLAVEFGKSRSTLGFDISLSRINELKIGKDSTLEVNSEDTVLGIYVPINKNSSKFISKDDNFFEFVSHAFASFKWLLFNQDFKISKYSIKLDVSNKLDRWIKSISDQSIREEYINEGVQIANNFINGLHV